MQTEPRILLIDDSDDYRYLVEQVFSRFLPQRPIRFFSSGEELRLFMTENPLNKPDLILLDLHMPGTNGIQTLGFLKRHPLWRHTPVIVMSSMLDKAEIAACYEAGTNSFLPKPESMTEFRELFETIVHYWLDINRTS